jgi:hypothetical protein
MKKAKYVTEETFLKFTEGTFREFADSTKGKFGRLTSTVLSLDERLGKVERNMATKDDINLVLNRIDSYAGRQKVLDQEQDVQALHINELRETSRQHEARISKLETRRSN